MAAHKFKVGQIVTLHSWSVDAGDEAERRPPWREIGEACEAQTHACDALAISSAPPQPRSQHDMKPLPPQLPHGIRWPREPTHSRDRGTSRRSSPYAALSVP